MNDLKLLPLGLHTIVGERGVQLSGGQKARVNLARAIYGDESIILLDDPLSAVDAECANHIFNQVVKGQLKDKTRILVTHATQFLDQVDRVIIMEADVTDKGTVFGRIRQIGTYTELLSAEKESTFSFVEELRLPHHKEQEVDQEHEIVIKKSQPVKYEEDKIAGSMRKMIYLKYITLSMGFIAVPLLLMTIISPEVISIYQQQYAINWLQRENEHKKSANGTTKLGKVHDHATIPDYQTYVGLAVGTILAILVRTVVYMAVIHGAGVTLHNRALYAVVRSPMRFFDATPIGTIINRFSKDTFFMDERWSIVSHLASCGSANILAAIALVIAANYWFIIPLTLLSVVLILIARYFIRTSVELRRIEAVKRSPIMSQISSTLAGLATIRASGQIDVYEAQHYQMRDDHTRCWVLYVAANHWFAYRLDKLNVCLNVLASFLLVSLRDQVGATVAGLALVVTFNTTDAFQWTVRMCTETENVTTAIERIFTFAELPSEAPLRSANESRATKDINCMECSNSDGVMEFQNVKLKYNPSQEADYVLHDLTFKTKPFEKIGIVGRSGAGKSTIFQALLRMFEPEGEILLDGRPTKEMGLHELRKAIGIIPQESLLFSGTLRNNLDPFSEYDDEEMWNVLKKVEIKSYVTAQEGRLDMKIQEGGSNLSVGQRQLLCLARALLRNCKFLIIDEATANVDKKTDEKIQRTIRETFFECTVLTIAHRINTIIDSDRVMVIDAGRLVEFDDPIVLLKKRESIFYNLVKETGLYDELIKEAQILKR